MGHEWYDAKHRPPSSDEAEFINSIPAGSCPRCGSENVRRDGRSKKTGLIVRGCLSKGAGFHRTRGKKAQNFALSKLGKGEKFR